MNIIKSTILSLIAVSACIAEEAQYEIEARYEGFDPLLFEQVHSALPEGVQAAPRVTAKAGQTAVIELVREVVLPVTPAGRAPAAPRGKVPLATNNAYGNYTVDGRKTANCGVALEISPELKNGQIILSGKSTIRRQQKPGAAQALNAVSFSIHETYFSDVVVEGQSVTIRVGNGPEDKAQITLKIKRAVAAAVVNVQR